MLLLFDISHHQIIKDYKKLAERTKGGYIKATEGGQTEPDSRFATHWSETGKHGLLRGAYHLWCPDFAPKDQARFFFETVESSGDHGELPPALDVEFPGKAADVRQCVEEIERLFGRTPIIYTNKFHFGDPVIQAGGRNRERKRCLKSKYTDQVQGLEGDKTWAAKYPLWFAKYISTEDDILIPWSEDLVDKFPKPNLPEQDKLPSTWGKWKIWQFSQRGRGPDWGTDRFASKQIDLDVFDGTLEDLLAFSGAKVGEVARKVEETVLGVLEGEREEFAIESAPAPGEIFEALAKSGIAPEIRIELRQGQFDIESLASFLAELKAKGVAPDVHLNLRFGVKELSGKKVLK